MTQHPINGPDAGGNVPLPTAEEIGARFGDDARRQWGTANDDRRRGMLKRWEREGVDAAKHRLPDTRREDMLALLQLHESYGRVPGMEAALAARKFRYEREMETMEDAYKLAVRSVHCRIVEEFLRREYVDFTDVLRGSMADPLCAALDEEIIGKIYLHFIRVLEHDGHIARETFDDDLAP
jgi:hypothetical protein